MAVSDYLSYFNYFPTWLLYVILFIGMLYLYGIWPYLNNTINLPGPKPTAFLGNMSEFAKKGPAAMDTDNLKKYGAVHLVWLGRRPLIHIADPDMVREISIKEFQNFTNRPLGVPLSPLQKLFISLLSDEHWKFVRSVISPAFSSGKLRAMTPLIQNCLIRLNQRLETKTKSGESFDITPLFEAISLEVIGAAAFGIDINTDSSADKVFLEKSNSFFTRNIFTLFPLIFTQFFPFTIRLFEAVGWTIDIPDSTNYLINILSQSVQDKREQSGKGRKDLLQLMVNNTIDNLGEVDEDKDVDREQLKLEDLNRDKKLSDDEIMAQAIIFLLAGFKTTSSAMSFLAYNLTVNTQCQDRLIQEIDEHLKGNPPTYDAVMSLPYLDMCLSETQRLYPALTGTHRVARNDTVINGQVIPKGVGVKLLGFSLQRDPRYWPEPDKFNPDRFSPEEKGQRNPYVYFPFGLGPRNCVGMRLAQLETKMAIVTILQKFRFVRATETQVPLKYKITDQIEAENGIWLKVERREEVL